MKFAAIVSPFRTQIVDLVDSAVLQLEKSKHLVDVVAVDAFDLVGRKAHCNEVGYNICQKHTLLLLI